jgi:hypothetical protein
MEGESYRKRQRPGERAARPHPPRNKSQRNRKRRGGAL